MGRAFSLYGEKIDAYRILEGIPKGKLPFGRPRRRWDDNIKWIFKTWDGACTGLICLRIGTSGGVLWMG
jgi:hypothetical protein